jgi:protein TonB
VIALVPPALAATTRGDLARWGLALALVLLAHGGVAAALLVHSPQPPDSLPSEAIAIDLSPEQSTATPDEVTCPEVAESEDPSPEPTSEPEPPAPDSPPPEFAEAKPVPETAPELTASPAPAPTPEVSLPPTPEEPMRRAPDAEVKPEKKQPEALEKKAKHDRRTAPSQARAATAALAGGGRPSAATIATWAARLGAHLAQHKRYPVEARARGHQGTAMLRVALNAEGHVLSRTLVRGSGTAALDQESMALIMRAQPMPKPPPNMAVPVTITVPVRFSIR